MGVGNFFSGEFVPNSAPSIFVYDLSIIIDNYLITKPSDVSPIFFTNFSQIEQLKKKKKLLIGPTVLFLSLQAEKKTQNKH